jgi:hypothetical protein
MLKETSGVCAHHCVLCKHCDFYLGCHLPLCRIKALEVRRLLLALDTVHKPIQALHDLQQEASKPEEKFSISVKNGSTIAVA